MWICRDGFPKCGHFILCDVATKSVTIASSQLDLREMTCPFILFTAVTVSERTRAREVFQIYSILWGSATYCFCSGESCWLKTHHSFSFTWCFYSVKQKQWICFIDSFSCCVWPQRALADPCWLHVLTNTCSVFRPPNVNLFNLDSSTSPCDPEGIIKYPGLLIKTTDFSRDIIIGLRNSVGVNSGSEYTFNSVLHRIIGQQINRNLI